MSQDATAFGLPHVELIQKPAMSRGRRSVISSLGVNTAHEAGQIHGRPVRILRFELDAELFGGVFRRDASFFLRSRALVRTSPMNFRSAATMEPSPGAL